MLLHQLLLLLMMMMNDATNGRNSTYELGMHTHIALSNILLVDIEKLRLVRCLNKIQVCHYGFMMPSVSLQLLVL